MRLIMITAALALMATTALAQTAPPAAPPPPPFVPWTVTQNESDAVIKFLSDKPYSFAQPIIDWLSTNEVKARAAADKVVADKVAPAPATEPKN